MYEIIALICLQNEPACHERVLFSHINGEVTCEYALEKDIKPSNYIVFCRPEMECVSHQGAPGQAGAIVCTGANKP